MASEREKKENELSRSRFHNLGQKRTLDAIDTQVERERRKVKRENIFFKKILLFVCREKNVIMQCDE
jgi:hypothetical protein